MVSSKSLAPILLPLAAQAATIPRDDTKGLQWGPCDLNTTLPVQCAKLAVPLDYTDKSSTEKLELDVIRYPAQKEPKRGSIMLNFGGPGQDGLTSMLSYAELMGPTTGGYHDLVSWDPRGTGKTLRFSCWPNDPSGYFGAMGGVLAGSADTATGRLWAEGEIIATQCHTQLGKTGELVGMAFAARDMMSIVDALGEDGQLRYWGISAGTTLGSTALAMFPDRLDKIVLDGVMNAHEYYNSFGEPEMVDSTDATFEQFMRGCVATPQNCALARNRTFEQLKTVMVELFDTIRNNPPVYNGTYVFDYSLFKGHIFNTLYRPASWPGLAKAMDDLLQGNMETFVLRVLGGGLPVQDQAILGIRCGDKKPRTTHLSDLDGAIEKYHKHSKWFWDWGYGYYMMPCAQWQSETKERYEGDFRVKTKKPVLFVGNTWDPVTPLASAKNMSSGFEGSVVLTHNGHGHTTLTQPSNCTNSYIQKYFLEGTLPAPDTVCEPNLPLFSAAE
ncbi:TAP-like protein-domain-containing protein [Hypomontagnella submonticulosa]|nr:TAP-like protein-domain-containing protein [Hypomontagnella submonticulosa]